LSTSIASGVAKMQQWVGSINKIMNAKSSMVSKNFIIVTKQMTNKKLAVAKLQLAS